MLSQKYLFLNYLAQTSPSPLLLEIKKAKGLYLYSEQRKKYIDLISGIGVSNIGHRHPKVIKAIKQQLKKHLHLMVYGELIQSPQVALAKKLITYLPEPLSSIYFVNSGSEAVEGALKLAKRYTGKTQLVSCTNAYHGSTHGALSVTGNENLKRAFRPLLPETYTIDFGNREHLNRITSSTAAVIIEPVQAEAGVRLTNTPYFQALRKKCNKVNALLIIDEIQTGFGRTGAFWGFEHYSIIPDIVVCAKAMGGGMPLGAFISSRKIMSSLTHNPTLGHITTFGGHPVSCAASLAALDVLIKEKLIEHVVEKENCFHDLLKHPLIKSIRSKGLLFAIEFDSAELVKKIIERGLYYNLLTDWFLFCDYAIRLAPPLTITLKEISIVCKKLIQTMDDVLNEMK